MFENLPLHPAIVHLPMALILVLPIVTVFLAALFFKGSAGKSALLVVVLLQAVLAGTSYMALETGEDEEHTVERVLSESLIENHEERAEVFMVATVVALVISLGLAAPWLPSMLPMKVVVGAVLLGQVALLALGYRVGHSGGELVYVHGAAQAYVGKQNAAGQPVEYSDEDGESHDDD